MLKFYRTPTAVGFALMILTAACNEDGPPVLDVHEPLAVELDRTAVHLCGGDLVTLDALVTGDETQTQRAVVFATRDPAVASIREQYGLQALIEGHANGATNIVAAAVADPAATDSAEVTVGSCSTPTPTVSITEMTRAGTNTPIDADSVTGAIDVHIEVTSAHAGSVAVLRVGSAATIDCGAVESDPDTLTCVVDTAARDSAGGLRFPNGSYDVSARVVRPDGIIIAATTRTLVFANP